MLLTIIKLLKLSFVDWALQSVILACTRFHGSHTADAIAEQLDRTTATFDLLNKISYIVTDNAVNMLKAVSLPGLKDGFK